MNSDNSKSLNRKKLFIRIAWIVAIVIWLASFIMLVLSLTYFKAGHPIKEHSFMIVIGFIAISGGLRRAYQKYKTEN